MDELRAERQQVQEIHSALERAGQSGERETLQRFDPIADAGAEFPHYPSGIESFDGLFGGFTGFTVLGGTGGAGKSLVSMGTGLHNAHESLGQHEVGDFIVFVDAEQHGPNVRKRMYRWYYSDNRFRAEFPKIRDNVCFFDFDQIKKADGKEVINMEPLRLTLREVYRLPHRRVILVLDSLQSIIRRAKNPSPNVTEWVALDWMLDWCRSLPKATSGRLCVIALNEANSNGGMRGGEQARHASDMCIWFKEVDDEKLDGDVGLVDVTVTKHRDGRKGKAGRFIIHWPTSRLEPHSGPCMKWKEDNDVHEQQEFIL